MARNEQASMRDPWIVRFVQEHTRVMLYTLGRLSRQPTSTFLTAAVIGITLAMPAGLHVLIRNVNAVSYSWEGTLQASLFLRDSTSEEAGRSLVKALEHRSDIAKAEYISREQSLAEFRELSGFGEALDLLQDNPLPAVIVITPSRDLDRSDMDGLIKVLSALPEVEVAKLDQRWLERLYAILSIIERVVTVIAAMLALAVVVTVGNTIRLDIESRREEIVVMKLIGAPDSFIRRPFLYVGMWYGLFGGVLAWILVHGALWSLSGPAQRLAGLYESNFSVTGLALETSLLVLGGGVLLGMLGSALTLGRHLDRYEPT